MDRMTKQKTMDRMTKQKTILNNALGKVYKLTDEIQSIIEEADKECDELMSREDEFIEFPKRDN